MDGEQGQHKEGRKTAKPRWNTAPSPRNLLIHVSHLCTVQQSPRTEKEKQSHYTLNRLILNHSSGIPAQNQFSSEENIDPSGVERLLFICHPTSKQELMTAGPYRQEAVGTQGPYVQWLMQQTFQIALTNTAYSTTATNSKSSLLRVRQWGGHW